MHFASCAEEFKKKVMCTFVHFAAVAGEAKNMHRKTWPLSESLRMMQQTQAVSFGVARTERLLALAQHRQFQAVPLGCPSFGGWWQLTSPIVG